MNLEIIKENERNLKMTSNFEKLFLEQTKDAATELSIAEKSFNEAKAQYAKVLEAFVEKNLFPNKEDLREQYLRELDYATEHIKDYSWELPYEFHHPADIYRLMISGHINLIDNEEISDIEATFNREAQ